MGWGLRVREEVRAGTLVCEYVGEIITEAQMRVSVKRFFLPPVCRTVDACIVHDITYSWIPNAHTATNDLAERAYSQ